MKPRQNPRVEQQSNGGEGGPALGVPAERRALEALARVKGELLALEAERLIQVNLHVPQAARTVLAVLPGLNALRERLARELPAFDLVAFDQLEDYALALQAAHAAVSTGGPSTAALPRDEVPELALQAAALRAKLLAHARALSLLGLLDARQLEPLKGTNGARQVARDLKWLSTALRESWPKIADSTRLSADDLEWAERVASRLLDALGLREQGALAQAAAIELRQRAFTRLFHTYEEARWAVNYLRRNEGAAARPVPSLYAGQSKRRTPSGRARHESTRINGTRSES
jgi:hypothetical protein